MLLHKVTHSHEEQDYNYVKQPIQLVGVLYTELLSCVANIWRENWRIIGGEAFAIALLW